MRDLIRPTTTNIRKAITMIRLSLLIAGLCCLATTSLADSLSDQSRKYQPQVGQPHADFVLPNIENGEHVWLSQYRGKKILLIHFASW